MQKTHAIEVQLDENHGVEIVEIKSECLVRGLFDGGDVSKNVSGTASAGEVLAVVHLVMVVAVVHLVMMVAVVLLAKFSHAFPCSVSPPTGNSHVRTGKAFSQA
ncbi:hypothetical protein FQR65_LT13831 [Abscondita terminalis]|nr:hypothetical protein FQR65_LT13831 [Abscondita terminalis]